MPLVITNEPIALEMMADGVLRVGGTRVTLDIVLEAYNEGATAEEIVQQYPTLKLADVYSVIGYYLRNCADLDAYLCGRREQAARIREQNEARFSNKGLRERLLARQASQRHG